VLPRAFRDVFIGSLAHYIQVSFAVELTTISSTCRGAVAEMARWAAISISE